MSSQPEAIEPLAVEYPGGSYSVLVGSGLLERLGPLVRALGTAIADRFLLVTDENVEPLYADPVLRSLQSAGYRASVFVLPAGEGSKQLSQLSDVYQACVQRGLDRRSAILALGGGVVGDVAGFAAATFLRGLPFVQIPTTLLAMVDSSIGGKVGVDLPQGKNLVGAFKQPLAVFVDTACLSSLPARQLRAGAAEIAKAALLSGDACLVDVERLAHSVETHGWISTETSPLLLRAVRAALLCKRDIVVADPFEQGPRALLNLGHTFAHAVEVWSRYEIPHGEAVALGILCALRLSHARGLCEPALVTRIHALLDRLRLPVKLARAGLCAHEILACMQTDKKRKGTALRFILLRQPGAAFIEDSVGEAEVLAVLRELDPKPSSDRS